ncbi:PA-phosphatase [Variovorax dokdonensis]|uniref:PA-phosphatase n=1 Tax=Variovorax dokdonensis TaxID=344883 RepID=A0ABT7NGB6_9BURK|nr:phosphatase PAP2 family protein [Variovorax dokdonensis]MDM0046989.1 PA-phosphatase [Variovorax dokdonensis]
MTLRDLLWQGIHAVPVEFWARVTWLGDSGLLLPAAVLIGIWLLVSRRTWPTALLWFTLFGSASLLVLVSKLAFLGWGVGSARLNFTGISGHSMMASSIWPVALWLLCARAGHRWHVGMAVAGWVLAWTIGVSRLALYAHSASEVAAGLLLGTAVSAIFLATQRHYPHAHPRAPMVLVSLLMPLALFPPGHAAPTQGLLEQIAQHLARIDRPFTRADLHSTAGSGPASVSLSATSQGHSRGFGCQSAVKGAALPIMRSPFNLQTEHS